MAYDAGDIEAKLTLDRDPFERGLEEAKRQAKAFEDDEINPKIDLAGIEHFNEQIDNATRKLRELGQIDARPKIELDGLENAERKIENITQKLRDLGRENAKPKIEIDGIEQARRQLDGLRERLNNLDNRRVSIKIDIDGVTQASEQINKIRREVNELNGQRINIRVDLDGVDRAVEEVDRLKRSVRELDNRSIAIRVNLDGAIEARLELEKLERVVRRLDGKTINIKVDLDGAAAAAAQLGLLRGALSAVDGASASMSAGIGQGSRALGGFNQMTVNVLQGIAQFLAYAVAIPAVMGAVTYAVGAAGAAIGALPALAAAAGAGFAVIKLGMDGIKSAYTAGLKPALDQLSSQISSTFQAKLTPVFRELARIIPVITGAMNNLAEAFSDTAKQITAVVTRADNIQRINNIFLNLANEVRSQLNPALAKIVESILKIAASGENMKALVGIFADAINNTRRWFDEISKVQNGTSLLTRSLQSLREVLNTAEQAFGQILTGAMKFFNQATPGVKNLISSIGDLAERVGDSGLGRAFGAAATAAGKFVSSISPATLEKLRGAFQELATTLGNLADSGILDKLAQSFADFIKILSGAVATISLVDAGFKILAQSFRESVMMQERDGKKYDEIMNQIGGSWDTLSGKATEDSQKTNEAAKSMGPAAQGAASQIDSAATSASQSYVKFGNGAWEAVQRTKDAGQQGSTAFDPMMKASDKTGQALAKDLPKGAKEGTQGANQALGQVNFDPLIQAAGQSMNKFADQIKSGIDKSKQNLNDGTKQMQAAVSENLRNLSGNAQTAMTQFGARIKQGIDKASRDVDQGMKKISDTSKKNLDEVSKNADQSMKKFADSIKKNVDTAQKSVEQGTKKIADSAKKNLQDASRSADQSMKKFSDAIKKNTDTAQRSVDQNMKKIQDTIKKAMDQSQRSTDQSMNKIAQSTKTKMEQTSRNIQQANDKIKESFKKTWTEEITKDIEETLKKMQEAVKKGTDEIKKIVDKHGQDITKSMDETWSKIVKTIEEKGKESVDKAKDIAKKILKEFEDLEPKMEQAGRKMMEALARGIEQGGRQAIAAARSVASQIAGLFPRSPAEWGPLSGNGDPLNAGGQISHRLADGITAQAASITNAMQKPLAAISQTMNMLGNSKMSLPNISGGSFSGTNLQGLGSSTGSYTNSTSNTSNFNTVNNNSNSNGMNAEQIRAIVNEVSRRQPTVGNITTVVPRGASVTDVVNQIAFEFRHASRRGVYS